MAFGKALVQSLPVPMLDRGWGFAYQYCICTFQYSKHYITANRAGKADGDLMKACPLCKAFFLNFNVTYFSLWHYDLNSQTMPYWRLKFYPHMWNMVKRKLSLPAPLEDQLLSRNIWILKLKTNSELYLIGLDDNGYDFCSP